MPTDKSLRCWQLHWCLACSQCVWSSTALTSPPATLKNFCSLTHQGCVAGMDAALGRPPCGPSTHMSSPRQLSAQWPACGRHNQTLEQTKKVPAPKVVWGCSRGPRMAVVQPAHVWTGHGAGCSHRWPLPPACPMYEWQQALGRLLRVPP